MKLVRILFLIFISGYYSKVLFQVINDQATYDNLKAFTIGAIISFFVATFLQISFYLKKGEAGE